MTKMKQLKFFFYNEVNAIVVLIFFDYGRGWKKKNDNKKKRKGKETSNEVSQSRKKKEKSSTLNEKEACTGSTDNDSGNMVWKRTSTSVVGKLRELEIKMKEGLAYMKANNPDIKEYKKLAL